MAAGYPGISLTLPGVVLAGYSGVFRFIWEAMPGDNRSVLPMMPLAASMQECSASARMQGALAGVFTKAGLVRGFESLPFREVNVTSLVSLS